jgi:hypothetical protein
MFLSSLIARLEVSLQLFNLHKHLNHDESDFMFTPKTKLLSCLFLCELKAGKRPMKNEQWLILRIKLYGAKTTIENYS